MNDAFFCSPSMRPPSILLADLGGTNSRFALAAPGGRPESIACLTNDGFAGAAAAIGHFLKETGARPVAGVLAVAGPVEGDAIALTNRDWAFCLSDLAREFGLSRLRALNDFEAVAWAVPGLEPGGAHPIGPLCAAGTGAKVVCGPGTGLGVAALVPAEESWRVVASEGGHIAFGAAATDEEPVFARLRGMTAGSVSAEMILSGPGLVRLHHAMHPGIASIASEAIVRGAQGGETEAFETVALFVRLLGRFAGDLALTFKATGGIYLTGGLGCGLGALLHPTIFRGAFETHPPHSAMLARIPTFVMTDEHPGLVGCAMYAQHMLRESAAA
jgi:glucokinase